jgi:hypothetical protein
MCGEILEILPRPKTKEIKKKIISERPGEKTLIKKMMSSRDMPMLTRSLAVRYNAKV